MWAIELVSPDKNHKIPEDSLYFKPRNSLSTYLQYLALPIS